MADMWQRLAKGTREALTLLRFELRKAPVDDVGNLVKFVETRAVHVAQTSLYGYVRTRMGTQYRDYFQDDVFSRSLRIGAVKAAGSCLADLAVFSAGQVGRDERLSQAQATRLAIHCFEQSLGGAFTLDDRASLTGDPGAEFRARVALVDCRAADVLEHAFGRSIGDVIRFAPVIDEFKDLDREIVLNSVRFRWIEAKDELIRRMDPAAVARDWLNSQAEGSPGK